MRAHGLLSTGDSTSITIDARRQSLAVNVAELSTDELRALARGMADQVEVQRLPRAPGRSTRTSRLISASACYRSRCSEAGFVRGADIAIRASVRLGVEPWYRVFERRFVCLEADGIRLQNVRRGRQACSTARWQQRMAAVLDPLIDDARRPR